MLRNKKLTKRGSKLTPKGLEFLQGILGYENSEKLFSAKCLRDLPNSALIGDYCTVAVNWEAVRQLILHRLWSLHDRVYKKPIPQDVLKRVSTNLRMDQFLKIDSLVLSVYSALPVEFARVLSRLCEEALLRHVHGEAETLGNAWIEDIRIPRLTVKDVRELLNLEKQGITVRLGVRKGPDRETRRQFIQNQFRYLKRLESRQQPLTQTNLALEQKTDPANLRKRMRMHAIRNHKRLLELCGYGG